MLPDETQTKHEPSKRPTRLPLHIHGVADPRGVEEADRVHGCSKAARAKASMVCVDRFGNQHIDATVNLSAIPVLRHVVGRRQGRAAGTRSHPPAHPPTHPPAVSR